VTPTKPARQQRSFRLHLMQDRERQINVSERINISENHQDKHLLIEYKVSCKRRGPTITE